MKKTITWVGIGLPWIAATVLLAVSGVQAYLDGFNFIPGMHAFKWISDLIIGALIYLPAMGIAMSIVHVARQRLRERGKLRLAMLLPATRPVP